MRKDSYTSFGYQRNNSHELNVRDFSPNVLENNSWLQAQVLPQRSKENEDCENPTMKRPLVRDHDDSHEASSSSGGECDYDPALYCDRHATIKNAPYELPFGEKLREEDHSRLSCRSGRKMTNSSFHSNKKWSPGIVGKKKSACKAAASKSKVAKCLPKKHAATMPAVAKNTAIARKFRQSVPRKTKPPLHHPKARYDRAALRSSSF